MKVAVVGSRSLTVKDIGKYLPENTTEIISGGAAGIDSCAREYSLSHGIKLKPDYARYGRKAAPLKRNITIIESADIVLAFWNGSSKGTKFVIESCERMGVEIKVYLADPKDRADFIAYTKQPSTI